MAKNRSEYDLAIVGAGASGLIAAFFAVRAGLSVILIEKESQAGNKLLLTGNGRCNITNLNFDKEFIKRSRRQSDRFLYSALSSFTVADCMTFFESIGIALVEEDRGRVFPVSGGARAVLEVLLAGLANQASFRYGAALAGIDTVNARVQGLRLSDGSVVTARNYLIATGSRAFPQIGADGSGLEILRSIGHEVIDFCPGLSPIISAPEAIAGLEGLSLSAVRAGLYLGQKQVCEAFGNLIFTAKGISGPLVHDLSNQIDPSKEIGDYEIRLDLFPTYERSALDDLLRTRFNESGKSMIANAWGGLLPQRLSQALLIRCGIEGQRLANTITRAERQLILGLLKSFRIPVLALPSFEQATICRGGIDLKQVDPASMRSRLFDNLYFSGEVLDLHGPSGGYNLQIAWSTGVLAARAIIKGA